MVLSHRDVAGDAGAPELRLHALAQGPIYRWTQAEVLVSGIRDWDLQFLEVPIKAAKGSALLVEEVFGEPIQTPRVSVIQVAVSIEPLISRVDLPPMRSVQLLIPAF
jgi:hypothetical protein